MNRLSLVDLIWLIEIARSVNRLSVHGWLLEGEPLSESVECGWLRERCSVNRLIVHGWLRDREPLMK